MSRWAQLIFNLFVILFSASDSVGHECNESSYPMKNIVIEFEEQCMNQLPYIKFSYVVMEVCDDLYNTTQCYFDEATKKCGEVKAKQLMRIVKPTVPDDELCGCCKEAIEYMESMGGHLYRQNGNDSCMLNETECVPMQRIYALPTSPIPVTELSSGTTTGNVAHVSMIYAVLMTLLILCKTG